MLTLSLSINAKRRCESGCNEVVKKAEQRSFTVNQNIASGIEVRIVAGLRTVGW